MRKFTAVDDNELITRLKNGGIGVIPTDTIYGVVACVDNQAAVERIYQLRQRSPDKPCIILVANRQQVLSPSLWQPAHKALADTYWPGPLSIIAPVGASVPAYLHRGTFTLAYRAPAYPELYRLLEATGPLIAPSANPEDESPATTLAEAEAYFGEHVDFYVDGGDLKGRQPSTLVRFTGQGVEVIRQGSLLVPEQGGMLVPEGFTGDTALSAPLV